MSFSYLFDPNKQFQDRNGVNNVGGFLRVYIDGTDDRATTYKDFNGTLNEADIMLDTDGRAVVIVDDSFTFRIEVYERDGALQWTVTQFTARGEGGSGGSSTPVVVDGTANEIDVTESMTAGVKYYTIGLATVVKNTLLGLLASFSNLVGILNSKADKVQGATAGNLASLDANGNLTDSGSKVADFKTKQAPVQDPSASGAGLEFIDSVSQDANGEITPHKKSVQDGTTAQKGVVKLSNAIDSNSVTEAATPKAVKDAYDELNNKIVARAVFLSQAEWAVQSQLPGDPAKVYYVENGTGEDAYTVYVWKESTSTYEEVDESSIELDGYWHDGPTTTGSGNVVTNITLGNDGVPQIEKGLTALTQHQSVTDNDPTLAWGTRSKVGTIGGTELHVTMPSNPASGKLDSTGDASNTTSTFTKASGDTSSMASGSKLSAIFTAISSFFASVLSALGGKADKANITGATKCKITYNSQGVVTAGADLGASDIPDLPASKITSGTFGTSSIADDAITAAKVKDNETLPVNVSGNAGSSYSLIGKNMVSGSNGYSLLATLELTNVNAVYAGAMLAVVCRGGVACFEGIVSVSLSEYTNAGNETAPIVGNVVVMNCRGANLEALTSKFDFYMLRIEAGKYQLYVHKKGSGLPVSCTLLAATECTCTLYSSGAIANLPSAIETKKLDWICNKGVGSPSTPVYVNSDGQVKECDPSGGVMKSNTAELYIAGYTDDNIPYYHVRNIKNGCVNHVNFSGITNSTCNITFEAPALSTGEEYDYIISLEGYTNNSGYSTGAYVENCKQILHYISDGNVWVGEGLFLQATDWRQICVVRGNTCEWKRVALS